MRGTAHIAGAFTAAMALLILVPGAALAHGAGAPPPVFPDVLGAWSGEPSSWLAVGATLVGFVALVVRVNRAHPRNPVPRRRVAAWLGGTVVLALAVLSPIDVYADTLFTVHMVQHLLLTMVAAPLLVAGAPVTLLLRALGPGRARARVLAALRSRPMAVIGHPAVAWIAFAGTMWISHFSPLFDAALEDPGVHAFEHALYLGVGLLFWWPVVGADPAPHRMRHAARLGYLLLGMPQNAFLGVAIYSARAPLYEHYATLERAWGPPPLVDQQIAGGLMWGAGDFLFLVPLLIAAASWFKAEEAEGRRIDARLDRERRARERAAAREPG